METFRETQAARIVLRGVTVTGVAVTKSMSPDVVEIRTLACRLRAH